MRIQQLILALVFVLASAFAWATDVTGTWLMAVDSRAGSGTPTFTLKQDGDKVTGNYKGQLGTWPVTGTVKGNELTLTYKVVGMVATIEFKFLGTVDGDNISGKVSMGQLGDGTFKGSRQK